MNRVFLWGWFGFENLGDDLLLDTMLKNTKGNLTVAMKKKMNIQGCGQVNRSYKNLLLKVFQNNVIVIGPGGLLPFDNKIKVTYFLLIVKMCKLLHKKIIFFGIGISEKMSDYSRFVWKKIAVDSDLFFPRSKKVIDRIGLEESESIHSMADCVFASNIVQDKSCENNYKAAISVANLQEVDKKIFNETVNVWVQVINKLLSKGFEVDVIAFTKGSDDRMVAAIKESFAENESVHPYYYKDANNIIVNWQEYKIAICMRFHSLVLSVLSGVPAVPLAYGHKIIALAEQCNLNDYLLLWNQYHSKYYGELKDITAADISNKIDNLLVHLDIVHETLLNRKNELKESALDSFKQLNDVINS